MSEPLKRELPEGLYFNGKLYDFILVESIKVPQQRYLEKYEKIVANLGHIPKLIQDLCVFVSADDEILEADPEEIFSQLTANDILESLKSIYIKSFGERHHPILECNDPDCVDEEGNQTVNKDNTYLLARDFVVNPMKDKYKRISYYNFYKRDEEGNLLDKDGKKVETEEEAYVEKIVTLKLAGFDWLVDLYKWNVYNSLKLSLVNEKINDKQKRNIEYRIEAMKDKYEEICSMDIFAKYCIYEIDGKPFNYEKDIELMTSKEIHALSEAYNKFCGDLDTSLTFICKKCGKEQTTELNLMSPFFFVPSSV